MPLPPINNSTGGFISPIFGNPKVVVQRKDGGTEELTRSELRRRLDPNNDDDLFTVVLEKVQDACQYLLDQLKSWGI